MTIENATTVDELDAAQPLGTDFLNEGDNHLRLIKAVIKNTLGTITGVATLEEAQAQSGQSPSKLMTALRVYESVTARLANQEKAEGGTDGITLMTPVRTAQYVSNRLATKVEAEGKTNSTRLMTPLRTDEQIVARTATIDEAKAGTATEKLMTALGVAEHVTNRVGTGASNLVSTSQLNTRLATTGNLGSAARYPVGTGSSSVIQGVTFNKIASVVRSGAFDPSAPRHIYNGSATSVTLSSLIENGSGLYIVRLGGISNRTCLMGLIDGVSAISMNHNISPDWYFWAFYSGTSIQGYERRDGAVNNIAVTGIWKV